MPTTPKSRSSTGTKGSPLEGGRRQYLIAPRRGLALAANGLRPMSAAHLRGLVKSVPDIDVVRVIHSRSMPAPTGVDEATDVYVARMDEDQAEVLRHAAPAHLIVEEDARLCPCASTAPVEETGTAHPSAPTGKLRSRTVQFLVLGDGDRPLPDATVTLTGELYPARGTTNAKGEATVELHPDTDEQPRSLLVTVPTDHWSCYLRDPDLSDSSVNVIRLQSLEESIQGFPEHHHYGWGARLMGLDRLDRRLTGHGVRVGIIDSGVDNRHPLLRHVQRGVDLVCDDSPTTWSEDVIGHGTHAAGTIAARSDSDASLRGFAPAAEIHAFRIFPGARFSHLIDALDLCIQHEIDVVNINFGCDQVSWAVEQKLEECALKGVACVVAAGSTGGPPLYPATSPWTLAVGAVGKLDEVAESTWECSTIIPDQVAVDGIFAPSFASHGPQIALSAPGVGVISTVPGGGFAPRSGASVAAPHVTGLAALILAHHPWVNRLAPRNHVRVAALFETIRSMCTPYALHPWRAGVGVPKVAALAAATAAAPTPAAGPWSYAPAPGWTAPPYASGNGAKTTS